MYLDTACEPWEDVGYYEKDIPTSQRSVYWLRHESLSVREYQNQIGKFPTVITSHG